MSREQVIQRLYQELFCRPADPVSLRVYMDSGLSEPQLRSSLRTSVEGERVAMVRRIYVEELERDPLGPDCKGLRTFVDSGLDEQQIRDSVRNSEEWRRLHDPTPGG